MLKKYLGLTLTIVHLQSICHEGKVFTMTVIPDEVEVVNITPYNNNRHIIEYRDGKGTIIKADESWRRKVLFTDPNTIKGLEGKRSSSADTQHPHAPKKEATICVVNNNDHTIIQNNSNVTQTEVKACTSPETKSSFYASSYFALLSGIFSDNKYKIIAGSCGVCWLAIYARLSYLSYTISSGTGWRNWSKNVSLETLQQADPTILAQELLKDIQHKYAKLKTNHLSTLVHFINDCDTEIAQINNLLGLHETLNTIKISFMFPKQTETLRTAIDQIQRVEFLKSIIIQATPELKKKYLI